MMLRRKEKRGTVLTDVDGNSGSSASKIKGVVLKTAVRAAFKCGATGEGKGCMHGTSMEGEMEGNRRDLFYSSLGRLFP
jgi:hypothetical protein